MKAIPSFGSLCTTHLHWLNSVNVVLLPKNEEAEEIDDYRPISLIHVVATIIVKVLVSRIASYMHTLVLQAKVHLSRQEAFTTTSCMSEILHASCINQRDPR